MSGNAWPRPRDENAAKKRGYSVISGKRVYTLPPKPSTEMLRLCFANHKDDREADQDA